MTIGPPDNPRDFEQVAVFGVVVANKLRCLLNDTIARKGLLDLVVGPDLRLYVVAAQIEKQKLGQEEIAQLTIEMALALAFVPDPLEEVSNPRFRFIEEVAGGGQQLPQPTVFHQELDI